MADAAEAGRAARPHRDAVHRQFAVLRHQHRREILDADARPARHDDDVRVARAGPRRSRPRRRGPARGSRPRRRRARPARPASVRWRRRSESPRGGVPAGSSSLPVITSRTRGRRTTATPAHADRAEDADILRAQHAAGLEQRSCRGRCPRRAGPTFLPGDTASRRDDRRCRPRRRPTNSAGSTASAPCGIGSARHDAHRLARRHRAVERPARHRVADDGERQPAVGRSRPPCWRRPPRSRPSSRDRIPARRRADDGLRQHAPRRLGQRYAFGAERLQLRVEPRERGRHRVPVREAAHANVRRLPAHGSRLPVLFVRSQVTPKQSVA